MGRHSKVEIVRNVCPHVTALGEGMIEYRRHALLGIAMLFSIAMLPLPAEAQWWKSHAPVDYEDCIETGTKTSDTPEAKTQQASQCEAKFAGRRKPGGGYTYFDFMQNRSFDIAGPNPTPDELRKMDEQYTEFLDQRRRQLIADAFAEKQMQEAQLASLQQDAVPPVRRPPLPKPRIVIDKAHQTPGKKASKPHPVTSAYVCDTDPLSCGFNHLSEGISAVKNSLLGPPEKKKHPTDRVATQR